MSQETMMQSQNLMPDANSNPTDSALYVCMLLELDSIPWSHNFSAA
ncbi:hypothetical protein ACJ72_06938, partial [Emergomyces africanus]